MQEQKAEASFTLQTDYVFWEEGGAEKESLAPRCLAFPPTKQLNDLTLLLWEWVEN
jgi:hypothetical protein